MQSSLYQHILALRDSDMNEFQEPGAYSQS